MGPGKFYLADPSTKPESPLAYSLQLLLESSSLPIYFMDATTQSSNLPTG